MRVKWEFVQFSSRFWRKSSCGLAAAAGNVFQQPPAFHLSPQHSLSPRTYTMNSKHLTAGSEFPPPREGKLRVYSMRFCPFAQRTLLVVEAKEIPHDIINVSLKDKPSWLLERNPEGRVPTIDTPQGPLYESVIVSEYLDEVYPQRRLVSSDPFQKALDKIWIEKSNKIANVYYKLMMSQDQTPEEISDRFKSLADTITPLEEELQRRGTEFFGGSEPGILDYTFWPWMERIPVLKIAFPEQDFESAKSQHPLMEKWRKVMKEDRAVKASYLSPEIHYKYILSHKAGSPDYDFLN